MGHALSVLAIGLFATAAFGDLARRRIPNVLCLVLAALGLVRIGLAIAAGAGAGAVAADLAVAALVFAAGALLFQCRMLGGGDVKLLAAGSLWLGAPAVGGFLLTTILAGGLLAAGFVIWTLILGSMTGHSARPSLPYGVAIATGGILATAAAF